MTLLAQVVVEPTLPPLIEPIWAKWFAIAFAYIITVALSGEVVGAFMKRLEGGDGAGPPAENSSSPAGDDHPTRLQRLDTGMVIGKCENIITVTFVLLGQETGLALIFGAKSIVRREDIKKNPRYYLGGTLINLCWGLLVAVTTRALVFGL
ncbi:MAG: hypothetical protein ACF8PN_09640 [Phycisphaerales bacterium]